MTVPSRRSQSFHALNWGSLAELARSSVSPMQVNMLEAKCQLSKLVKAAMAGEDVIIASHGKPQVRLVPCATSKGLEARCSLASLYQGSAAQIDAALTEAVDQEVAHLLAH